MFICYKLNVILIFVFIKEGYFLSKESYLPNYTFYNNLSQINNFISKLFLKHIKVSKLYSTEGRPIFLIKISNKKNINKNKMKILFVSGFHAREFLPVESVLYFLEMISKTENSVMSKLIDDISLYFIPMINPDGRYKLESSGDYCWRGNGDGIDIERNFDWGFTLSQDMEERSGNSPFSTVEAKILGEFLSTLSFDAYISLHSGIRHIYIPFADSFSKQNNALPKNYRRMMDIAAFVVKGMSLHTGLMYKYGVGYQLAEYTANGVSMDFAAGRAGVPFSFTLELWGDGDAGDQNCFVIFNPPNEKLKINVQQIHFMLQLFISELASSHRLADQRRFPFYLTIFVFISIFMIIFVRSFRYSLLGFIKYILRKVF